MIHLLLDSLFNDSLSLLEAGEEGVVGSGQLGSLEGEQSVDGVDRVT
jgi:hypothetical protein